MDRIEETNRNGPHLIETTMSGYEQRTYMVGLDVSWADLTGEEKRIVEESTAYIKQHEAKKNERLLNLARKDFERLRDMDLPDEAMAIVKQWTWRDEDDCE